MQNINNAKITLFKKRYYSKKIGSNSNHLKFLFPNSYVHPIR